LTPGLPPLHSRTLSTSPKPGVPVRTPPRHSRGGLVVESVLDLVGDTPLVRLNRLGRDAPRADVWCKMELWNPGGSVKDRICLAMIEAAERSGALTAGGVVVEPTSGNTGIGLALVCAVKGYRCVLTMPESMSLERRQLLEAFGAEVVLTPAEDQMEGAIREARAIAAREKRAFLPQQFDNPENPKVHAATTAVEILSAMKGVSFDAFVAGVGTGGTISGAGEVFRKELGSARPRIIAVEPDACATLSRGERGPTKIQGLAAGFVPKNYHAAAVDLVRTVTDVDAWRTKVALAREEALLVGISAGAAVFVALDVARELGPGKNVVTVLPDGGERYFSLEEYFDGSHDEAGGVP
jgi:cysteine synthase